MSSFASLSYSFRYGSVLNLVEYCKAVASIIFLYKNIPNYLCKASSTTLSFWFSFCQSKTLCLYYNHYNTFLDTNCEQIDLLNVLNLVEYRKAVASIIFCIKKYHKLFMQSQFDNFEFLVFILSKQDSLLVLQSLQYLPGHELRAD